MQPLVQKDALAQAKRMTVMVLSDKPECAALRERMKEAGRGSQYEGATRGSACTLNTMLARLGAASS